MDQRNAEAASLLVQQVPNSVRSLRSQSLGQNLQASSHNAAQELYRRARSTNDIAVSSPDDTEGFSTPRNRVGTEVSSDESERPSRRSPSGFSTCSDGAVEAALTPNLINEISENVIDLTLSHLIKEDLRHSSPPSVLVHILFSFNIVCACQGMCIFLHVDFFAIDEKQFYVIIEFF